MHFILISPEMVGVFFCDQSAAFDLCDHNILAEKMKLMGLEDQALTWIKSYLSGRKQSCFIDGELSTPLNLLNCGVPQGSIGGPLLWLCFTCDQLDVIHDHEVKAVVSNTYATRVILDKVVMRYKIPREPSKQRQTVVS